MFVCLYVGGKPFAGGAPAVWSHGRRKVQAKGHLGTIWVYRREHLSLTHNFKPTFPTHFEASRIPPNLFPAKTETFCALRRARASLALALHPGTLRLRMTPWKTSTESEVFAVVHYLCARAFLKGVAPFVQGALPGGATALVGLRALSPVRGPEGGDPAMVCGDRAEETGQALQWFASRGQRRPDGCVPKGNAIGKREVTVGHQHFTYQGQAGPPPRPARGGGGHEVTVPPGGGGGDCTTQR